LPWQPLLLLPERVARDVQVQDKTKGSLVRDLRTRVVTHDAGRRGLSGADLAPARSDSARVVDEGTARPYTGQNAGGHEIPDLGPEDALR
jgi:hypothetical protein